MKSIDPGVSCWGCVLTIDDSYQRAEDVPSVCGGATAARVRGRHQRGRRKRYPGHPALHLQVGGVLFPSPDPQDQDRSVSVGPETIPVE